MSQAVDECDSECYLRHHLCAIREVKRIRLVLDRMLELPADERFTGSQLMDLYNSEFAARLRLEEKVKLLTKDALRGVDTVPAAWLARANAEIENLNTIIIANGIKRELGL